MNREARIPRSAAGAVRVMMLAICWIASSQGAFAAPRTPSGPPNDLPPAAAPGSKENSPPPTAPPDVPPATPLETLINFAKAIDENNIRAARSLATGKPEDDELLAALCAAAGASRDMREAAAVRFGKGAEALHEVSFTDQVLYGREKFLKGSNTATVDIGARGADEAVKPANAAKSPSKDVIALVKVNDQWKVDLGTLPQKRDADAIARAKSHAHAAGSVAAGIKAGEYTSIREAGAALEQKAEAAFEAEARLARLNAKARERGGDASSAPINKPNLSRPTVDPKKEWIGKEKSSAVVRATATNESLADKSRTVEGGARVTPLITKDVADVKWSADGRFALILQKDGVLRKVAVPSLVEERRIDLAVKPGDLAVCRTSICVAVPAANELLLLDPATLDVKRHVPLPGIRRLTASPASTYVYASDSEDQLAVVNAVNGDTKYASAASLTDQALQLTGKPAKSPGSKPSLSEPEDLRVGFHLITASPDGTMLYCADHLRIYRLRIRGATVSYEDSSPEIGSDAREIAISTDGQYVALPIGAGNLEIPQSPRPPFATYVFRGADLHKPVLTIDAGPHPQAMAFDPKAHVIYTQNDERQLILFSSQGELGKQFELVPKGKTSTQILAHSSGGKLLVLIDGKAIWVELGTAVEDK